MVGGIVESVFREVETCITVMVQGRDEDRDKRLCITLEPTPDAGEVDIGDSLWWQSTNAYWTPKDQGRQDVPIPRRGVAYSPDSEHFFTLVRASAILHVKGEMYGRDGLFLLLFSKYDLANRYRAHYSFLDGVYNVQIVTGLWVVHFFVNGASNIVLDHDVVTSTYHIINTQGVETQAVFNALMSHKG